MGGQAGGSLRCRVGCGSALPVSWTHGGRRRGRATVGVRFHTATFTGRLAGRQAGQAGLVAAGRGGCGEGWCVSCVLTARVGADASDDAGERGPGRRRTKMRADRGYHAQTVHRQGRAGRAGRP